MSDSRPMIGLAIILAILLLVVAGVYFAEPARSLPSFFPGHSGTSTTHHIKHGIVSVAVALALFVFAWFASAPGTPAAGR